MIRFPVQKIFSSKLVPAARRLRENATVESWAPSIDSAFFRRWGVGKKMPQPSAKKATPFHSHISSSLRHGRLCPIVFWRLTFFLFRTTYSAFRLFFSSDKDPTQPVHRSQRSSFIGPRCRFEIRFLTDVDFDVTLLCRQREIVTITLPR